MKEFFNVFSEKTFVNNGMNFLTPTGCIPLQQQKMS